MRSKFLWFVIFFIASCQRQHKPSIDFYSSELFQRVQLDTVFLDSKTFVDCIPKLPLSEILDRYETEKKSTTFDLKKFVLSNFELPHQQIPKLSADVSLEVHLNHLWTILQRNPDEPNSSSSLIPLPHTYVVPGGRFTEIYYWDSYFTMLGLMPDHKALVKDMIDNFSFLIDSIGFIPNGNRKYYLSRSQPPFFSLMVKLWQQQASLAPLKYLPSLVKEYSFWMKGEEQLHRPGEALNHVVIMPDGSIMNRYFDFGTTPRPESYREDLLLSQSSDRKPEVLYSEMRSAAESGWDFSSRWLIVDTLLQTIQTTSIVPVDLNCLLWHLETTISEGFQLKGDEKMKQEFRQKARDRRKAIITFCYNPTDHYFFDYNFKSQKQSRHKTLAGAYPLFFKLVEPLVAEAVGREIESEFLKPGGLVTTLIKSKQQWDAPNGWAPLQWMVYKGLRNYKMIALAKEIKKRWMTINKKVYQRTGRMVEKYNVIDTTLIAGGGEYPTQDGFGWTNGVYLAMLRDTTSAN